jgi:hypothetical protein
MDDELPCLEGDPHGASFFDMPLTLRTKPLEDDGRVDDEVGQRASRSALTIAVESPAGLAAKSPSSCFIA